MKNKKHAKATPVIETKNEGYEKGSVGEFMALLSEFPKDAKFTLNGNVDIDSDEFDEGKGITIYPKAAAEIIEDDVCCTECGGKCEPVPYEGNEDEYHEVYCDELMKLHLHGIGYNNDSYLKINDRMRCFWEITKFLTS